MLGKFASWLLRKNVHASAAIPTPDVTPSLAEIYGDRIPWELPVQYCAADCIAPGDSVLDIGGHLGAVAIAFSRMVGVNGKVFTFEPNREMWPHLLENIKLNQAANIVHIPLACFSDTAKLMTFYAEQSFYKAGSGLVREIKGANSFEVVTISIDDFCERNALKPTLIKIDVEGAEIHVLRSMSTLLETKKPAIIIEYQATNGIDANDPLVFLQAKDYVFFDTNTYQAVSSEIYSNMKDFPLVNVLCLHKDSVIAQRYLKASIELIHDTGPLSAQAAEKTFELAPGRYIAHLSFSCPDNVVAGIGVQQNGSFLAYFEATSSHLRQHSCSNLVLELKETGAITPMFFRRGSYDGGLTKIEIFRVHLG